MQKKKAQTFLRQGNKNLWFYDFIQNLENGLISFTSTCFFPPPPPQKKIPKNQPPPTKKAKPQTP